MIGTTIQNHYLIQKIIGKGNFCAVYLAADPLSLTQVAVKVLKEPCGEGDLTREVSTLAALNHIRGVPKLLGSGLFEQHLYIVQELLDTDVYSLQRKCNPLPIPIVLSIAYAGIKVLKDIHDAGYLHLDLKPDNIGVKRSLKGIQIYLMDFGLAKKYKSHGIHCSSGFAKDIRGHPVFASIPVLKGLKPSRRDDLESFLYTLAFMANGTLPWRAMTEPTFGGYWREMATIKEECSAREICGKLPKQFAIILSLVRELSFEEKPSYKFYQELLKQAANQLSLNLKDVYIWDQLFRYSGKINPISPISTSAASIDANPRSIKRHLDIPPIGGFPTPHLSEDEEPEGDEFEERRGERKSTLKTNVAIAITPRLRRHIEEVRMGFC